MSYKLIPSATAQYLVDNKTPDIQIDGTILPWDYDLTNINRLTGVSDRTGRSGWCHYGDGITTDVKWVENSAYNFPVGSKSKFIIYYKYTGVFGAFKGIFGTGYGGNGVFQLDQQTATSVRLWNGSGGGSDYVDFPFSFLTDRFYKITVEVERLPNVGGKASFSHTLTIEDTKDGTITTFTQNPFTRGGTFQPSSLIPSLNGGNGFSANKKYGFQIFYDATGSSGYTKIFEAHLQEESGSVHYDTMDNFNSLDVSANIFHAQDDDVTYSDANDRGFKGGDTSNELANYTDYSNVGDGYILGLKSSTVTLSTDRITFASNPDNTAKGVFFKLGISPVGTPKVLIDRYIKYRLSINVLSTNGQRLMVAGGTTILDGSIDCSTTGIKTFEGVFGALGSVSGAGVLGLVNYNNNPPNANFVGEITDIKFEILSVIPLLEGSTTQTADGGTPTYIGQYKPYLQVKGSPAFDSSTGDALVYAVGLGTNREINIAEYYIKPVYFTAVNRVLSEFSASGDIQYLSINDVGSGTGYKIAGGVGSIGDTTYFVTAATFTYGNEIKLTLDRTGANLVLTVYDFETGVTVEETFTDASMIISTVIAPVLNRTTDAENFNGVIASAYFLTTANENMWFPFVQNAGTVINEVYGQVLNSSSGRVALNVTGTVSGTQWNTPFKNFSFLQKYGGSKFENLMNVQNVTLLSNFSSPLIPSGSDFTIIVNFDYYNYFTNGVEGFCRFFNVDDPFANFFINPSQFYIKNSAGPFAGREYSSAERQAGITPVSSNVADQTLIIEYNDTAKTLRLRNTSNNLDELFESVDTSTFGFDPTGNVLFRLLNVGERYSIKSLKVYSQIGVGDSGYLSLTNPVIEFKDLINSVVDTGSAANNLSALPIVRDGFLPAKITASGKANKVDIQDNPISQAHLSGRVLRSGFGNTINLNPEGLPSLIQQGVDRDLERDIQSENSYWLMNRDEAEGVYNNYILNDDRSSLQPCWTGNGVGSFLEYQHPTSWGTPTNITIECWFIDRRLSSDRNFGLFRDMQWFFSSTNGTQTTISGKRYMVLNPGFNPSSTVSYDGISCNNDRLFYNEPVGITVDDGNPHKFKLVFNGSVGSTWEERLKIYIDDVECIREDTSSVFTPNLIGAWRLYFEGSSVIGAYTPYFTIGSSIVDGLSLVASDSIDGRNPTPTNTFAGSIWNFKMYNHVTNEYYINLPMMEGAGVTLHNITPQYTFTNQQPAGTEWGNRQNTYDYGGFYGEKVYDYYQPTLTLDRTATSNGGSVNLISDSEIELTITNTVNSAAQIKIYNISNAEDLANLSGFNTGVAIELSYEVVSNNLSETTALIRATTGGFDIVEYKIYSKTVGIHTQTQLLILDPNTTSSIWSLALTTSDGSGSGTLRLKNIKYRVLGYFPAQLPVNGLDVIGNQVDNIPSVIDAQQALALIKK